MNLVWALATMLGWAMAYDVIIHDGRLIVAGTENDHPAGWTGEWTEEGT